MSSGEFNALCVEDTPAPRFSPESLIPALKILILRQFFELNSVFYGEKMKVRLIMVVCCALGVTACEKDSGTNAEPESELIAVTELKVTRIGRNVVRVEWKDNSRGEEGYLVERKANEGDYEARLFATLDATGVVDSSGLQIDTTYAYRVQPIRYFERGPLSDPVTIRLTLPFP